MNAKILGVLLVCATANIVTSRLVQANEAEPGTISFEVALQTILTRSTQIQVQSENANSIKETNRPSRYFLAPTVSANAKTSSAYTSTTPISQGSQSVELQAGVNVFRFGADYKTFKAAINDENQQDSLTANVTLQAEDQAVQALVTSIQRRLEREVLSQQVEVRKEALSIAQQRFERGFLSEQEVQKVLIDLENARSRATEGELLSIQADAVLKDLLGSTNIQILWPWKTRFSHWKVEDFIQAHPLDVTKRPDWKSADYHLSAEDDRTSKNYRLMLPSLDASLVYGYYHYNYNAGVPNGPAWLSTLTLTLPLFDRFTNLSNARAESAIERQAEIQRVEIERTALSQYEAARDSFKTLIHSAQDRESTLLKSKNLYRDSLRRFENGRSDTNELLIDQTRALDSELLAISGWAEAHTALSTLCHNLGQKLSECLK